MFRRKHSQNRIRRGAEKPSMWRHILLGVGACLSVALILTGVWYGTRVPAVTIAHVVVTGGDTIDHTVVDEAVESALGGSYLNIIPHRFSFMYPHDAIATAVASIARVKDVQVVLDDKKTLAITFSEYTPAALWCTEGGSFSCYFLDETGYAFAPGPRLDGGALVRHIFETGGELEKKQVFSHEEFARTHAFLLRLLTELSLRITDVYYTKDGDMRLMVNGGGEIRLRNDGSYDAAFNNLASVLASKEFKHLEPGNFQYIDLRFGNKVFVNEEEPTATTTTPQIGESATTT